jgi:hypothetical protein
VNPVFFLLLFFYSLTAYSNSLDEISKSKSWLRLLHYQNGESQADGMAFFLAKDGKTNSLSELKSSVEILKSDNLKRCQFPARYMFLAKELNWTFESLNHCSSYQDFKNKLDVRSASIIFSSYYINTPASAFGHTLLRLNRTQHNSTNEDQGELLDYGINYAAVMDTNNSLVYAFKGMAGMFQGKFTAIPYYYKVREYNDFESRDLWEYKLNLTQSQLDLLVAHLWELGHTYFDYYYFTENCSYHILSLLEVANPKLELISKLPFYIIPIDTVRVLFQEQNLVQATVYRPSVLSRLEEKTKFLNNNELDQIRSILKDPNYALPESANKQKAKIFETSIDAFDYLNSEDLVFDRNNKKQQRHEILMRRSEVDYISETESIQISKGNFPQDGHKSQRIKIAMGERQNEGEFFQAGLRFALHDWLDPINGQPPYSEIEFFNLDLSIDERNNSTYKFHLDDFHAFKVSSFQPITQWQNNISWTATLGAKNIMDKTCIDCFSPYINLGGGASVAHSDFLFSFLTKAELNYSTEFMHDFRFKFGPTGLIRWIPNSKFSLGATLDYHWLSFLHDENTSKPWIEPNFEMRFHQAPEQSFYFNYQNINDHGRFAMGVLKFY